MDLELPAQLDGRHVLVVPAGTDVLALATAWFPEARWERRPGAVAATPAAPPMTGARFRGMVQAVPTQEDPGGVIRLDADCSLLGPTPLAADRLDGYALEGSAPGGLTGAALDLAAGWLTAAARRCGGRVVTADRSRTIAPDPASMVDLSLWSPVPLAVQDALAVARPAMVGARVGPTDVPHPSQRLGPQSFAVTATFEYDGAVSLRTERSTEVPVVLATLDWREYGPWAYHVVWQPLEPEQLAEEVPSPLHVIARQRVAPTIARVVAALWRTAGGVVVDGGGFVVTPDELRDRSFPAG